jgi:hypothetical protein
MGQRGPAGNGSGKVNIHQQDMGGWVRIYADAAAAASDDLMVWLSHSLTEWFRQRPQLRMKTVAAMTRGGDTVELHGGTSWGCSLISRASTPHP